MAKFRPHFFVIWVAILVGLVYAGPYLYHTYTPEYQGIFMADATDSDFYLSVINKSYESVGFVRDPFHYEYQHEGHPFQYFPIEFIVGKLGALFHVRIDHLAILMEFFFPALLTLLLYAFGYWLTKRRHIAVSVAVGMLLGTELVHPNGLSNFFNTFLFRGHFTEFLAYSRPINPQASALFFFASIAALYFLWVQPHSKRAAGLAGLSIGVLAYLYPYFWAFAVVLLGIMGIYALVMRDWKFVAVLCLSGCAMVFVMVPFLLVTFPVFVHGSGSLAQAIPTHRFIVEKVILLPLFVYGLVFMWGRWGKKGFAAVTWAEHFASKYSFVLLLLIAGVVVSNHQVLDGRLFYQQHFHFFTNIPVFMLAVTILGMEALNRRSKVLQSVAAGAFIVVCVWFAISVQVASYTAHAAESGRYQAAAPVFAYLQHEGSGKVVFTDYYLSTRLTMYTPDFAYGGAYDTSFLVPPERLRHDYFVMLALRGVTAQQARSYLYQHKEEVGGLLFIGTYWRDLCGSYHCFPDSVLEELVPEYQSFLKQPLAESIRAHKIDYVLWDTKADSEWKLSGLVQTPPAFENGDFILYSLR